MGTELLTGEDGRWSYHKTVPAFFLGIVFAFWIVFLSTFLVHAWFPIVPEIPWAKVDGYFNWAIITFLPVVSIYLFTRWQKTKPTETKSVIKTEVTTEQKINGSIDGGNEASSTIPNVQGTPGG